MVIVPDAAVPVHDAVTPSGKPVMPAVLMPVAPVVVKMVISGEISISTHSVGSVILVAVLVAVTVIVPSAFTVPQPPVNGML